jgi:hypothetical protein
MRVLPIEIDSAQGIAGLIISLMFGGFFQNVYHIANLWFILFCIGVAIICSFSIFALRFVIGVAVSTFTGFIIDMTYHIFNQPLFWVGVVLVSLFIGVFGSSRYSNRWIQ